MAVKNDITSLLVGSIKKNERGDYINVSRSSYKGAEGIDIRNFYTNGEGELAPTQKGVNINSELLGEVMALVLKAMSIEEFLDFSDTFEVEKARREMTGEAPEEVAEDEE
jgi:hypothetical protein